MNWHLAIAENFKGIIDTTLREGLQFRRANFSFEQKRKILRYLTDINIDYAELWNPAVADLRQELKDLVACPEFSKPFLLAHIRNNLKDFELAVECRLKGVNILCTADEERIAALKISFAEYLRILEQIISTAQQLKMEVRVSVEDYFHQNPQQALAIYQLAEEKSVQRIGVADTKGSASFWELSEAIKSLRRTISRDIEVHLHNDLGLAVSNGITALFAGANWIDTTFCGIGERTGITPLSSLLLNLYCLIPEIEKRYNLELLTEAENYIAEACGIEVPINLLTNRQNGFAHKAGIHLDAICKFGPQKYELIAPQIIGNRRILVNDSPISGKFRLQQNNA